MGYRDMRGFIARLEEEGELQRITAEVDWNLELSAIMRRVFEVGGPACLFERVKGYTFPVFSGGLFGHRKYGIAVGTQPNIRSALGKVLTGIKNPILPVTVNEGPCKENIDIGGQNRS